MNHKTLKLDDVKNLDLSTLSALVAGVYHKDKTAISGAVFAHLAKQLLAAETQPGGPYKDLKSATMPELNAHIGRLFVLMGKPLPNIDTYLDSLQPSDLAVNDVTAIKQYKLAHQAAIPVRSSSAPTSPYRLARATLESIEEPVRTQALQFLERVEAADTTSEIAFISHFTAHAVNAQVSLDKLNKLGEANIHGWIAYMIYDHIIDSEVGIQLLPIANICMRLSLDGYRHSLPARHVLQERITQYFDQVDSANAWELANARFEVSGGAIQTRTLPEYQKNEILARRSAIHILGPIIIASHASLLAQKPAELDELVSGLHQYLIARQLSDDIHDWREDLAAGQISAVVAQLLRNYGIEQDTSYDISELTTALQHDFLQQTSQDIGKSISYHAKSAVTRLVKAGCDEDSDLVGLVTRLENMAEASTEQRLRFLEFQQEYQGDSPLNLQETA